MKVNASTNESAQDALIRVHREENILFGYHIGKDKRLYNHRRDYIAFEHRRLIQTVEKGKQKNVIAIPHEHFSEIRFRNIAMKEHLLSFSLTF